MGNALDPILFIMRNQYGQFDWRNLDPAIESAVAIASRLGRDDDEKVLRTTLLRGRRLAHTSRGDHATTLALFTDILPCDRGVAREVFEADAVGFRNKQRNGTTSGTCPLRIQRCPVGIGDAASDRDRWVYGRSRLPARGLQSI